MGAKKGGSYQRGGSAGNNRGPPAKPGTAPKAQLPNQQPLPHGSRIKENDADWLTDIMKTNISKALERGDTMEASNRSFLLLVYEALNLPNGKRILLSQSLKVLDQSGFAGDANDHVRMLTEFLKKIDMKLERGASASKRRDFVNQVNDFLKTFDNGPEQGETRELKKLRRRRRWRSLQIGAVSVSSIGAALLVLIAL